MRRKDGSAFGVDGGRIACDVEDLYVGEVFATKLVRYYRIG